jgi:hypothetical protein
VDYDKYLRRRSSLLISTWATGVLRRASDLSCAKTSYFLMNPAMDSAGSSCWLDVHNTFSTIKAEKGKTEAIFLEYI